MRDRHTRQPGRCLKRNAANRTSWAQHDLGAKQWNPVTVHAALHDLSEELGNSDRQTHGSWLVLGAGAYFALGLLGRITIDDGEVLSLVWPAAGAAMLLFGLADVRWWGLVALLVGVTTIGLNLLTGATATQAGIFVVSNILQAMCAVLILRALAPRLWGAGGDRPLDQLTDFWPVVAASVVGSLVGAAVGALGRGLLLDDWSATDLAVWWCRNATGCIVIFTTVLLARAAWPTLRGPAGRATLLANVRARALEAGLLVAFTLTIYLGVFGVFAFLPVAFLLLVPTVWAGLRFSALGVALHSLAVCTLVVAFTLQERGPFAAVGPWSEEVLVAQLFIALVFCLGILLSLGRGERLSLTANLSSARAVSESQAEVLSAIIDTMHDGVTLIDESGQVLRRNPAGAELVRTETDRLNNIGEWHFTMTTHDGRALREDEYPWVRAIAGENVVDQDIVIVFADGSPSRTLAVSARRLPTREGGKRQAVMVYHDVTSDRAQRTALESFARVVAHDLRGPLGVIDGWTEMLALDLEDAGRLVPGPGCAEARADPGRCRRDAPTDRRPPGLLDLARAAAAFGRREPRGGGAVGGGPAGQRRRARPRRRSTSATSPSCTPTRHWCGSSSTTSWPTPSSTSCRAHGPGCRSRVARSMASSR